MELGATLCAPKIVKCEDCPLNRACAAHELAQELAFPVKQGQQRVTESLRLTLVLRKGDRFLINKRPAEGLLANLWEFPGEEIFQQDRKAWAEQTWPAAVAEFFENAHSVVLDTKVWYELYQRVIWDRVQDQNVWYQLEQHLKVKGPLYHVFSHRRWEMYWIVLDCSEELQPQEGMRWVSREELEKIAFPVAFQKVLIQEL